ncbi:hypothetical protein D3C75_1376900 [compost metagenome]
MRLPLIVLHNPGHVLVGRNAGAVFGYHPGDALLVDLSNSVLRSLSPVDTFDK